MKSFKQHLQEETCAILTHKQIKQFEVFVDRMFKKFGIDFNFTKHFTDRLSHKRNNPCIKIEELAALIKKIYAKQGKPLHKHKDIEVVIKDLQSDLNMPVAVEYDAKNDEIDVVAKTIMRKKDFKSPDKKIVY